jgi:hypothetical protein
MGSPIDHGASSVPGAPLKPGGACQNARTFNALSEKNASRFEEVNNYSRLMTSRFYDACP